MLKGLMTVIGIVFWLLAFATKPKRNRGRVLSDEEMDAMLKECVGKDQKEVRKIQHRYLYE